MSKFGRDYKIGKRTFGDRALDIWDSVTEYLDYSFHPGKLKKLKRTATHIESEEVSFHRLDRDYENAKKASAKLIKLGKGDIIALGLTAILLVTVPVISYIKSIPSRQIANAVEEAMPLCRKADSIYQTCDWLPALQANMDASRALTEIKMDYSTYPTALGKQVDPLDNLLDLQLGIIWQSLWEVYPKEASLLNVDSLRAKLNSKLGSKFSLEDLESEVSDSTSLDTPDSSE